MNIVDIDDAEDIARIYFLFNYYNPTFSTGVNHIIHLQYQYFIFCHLTLFIFGNCHISSFYLFPATYNANGQSFYLTITEHTFVVLILQCHLFQATYNNSTYYFVILSFCLCFY